jgi:hypothetical protein
MNSEGCAVFSAAAVAAGGISKRAMGSQAAIRTVREAMLGPSEINPLYSWKCRVPRQLCVQRESGAAGCRRRQVVSQGLVTSRTEPRRSGRRCWGTICSEVTRQIWRSWTFARECHPSN